MKQNLNVKTGEVIVLTSGEYSEYMIDAYLVFIKDADLKPLAQEFYDSKANERGHFDMDGFAGFLISKEIAIPVLHREIHLGNYGKFDDSFEIKEKDV